MTSLRVQFEEHLVGTATAREDRFLFAYSQEWLRWTKAFPLSASLPLRQAPWPEERAHVFFANLLPEGVARDAVCRRLGLSSENDVALLRALGNDTAGAFRFVATDVEPSDRGARDRVLISSAELESWSTGEPALPAALENAPRLSLAGAQHKVAVVETDGGYALGARGEASTHILKFDAHRFPHLSANEFLTNRFARALGLKVCHVELNTTRARPFLVVRRYDREERDGDVKRLHQEDFCQIFGLSPRRKYEGEGGVSLRQIADAVRQLSSRPAADLLELFRWSIFCAVSGNADGHAKNLSILYDESGPILAPFYDLVCTRAFDGLHPDLAFAIGEERNPDRLHRHHFHDLARAFGIRPRLADRELDRQLEGADTAFARAAEELREAVDFTPALERVQRAVQKRLRAIQNNIDQDDA